MFEFQSYAIFIWWLRTKWPKASSWRDKRRWLTAWTIKYIISVIFRCIWDISIHLGFFLFLLNEFKNSTLLLGESSSIYTWSKQKIHRNISYVHYIINAEIWINQEYELFWKRMYEFFLLIHFNALFWGIIFFIKNYLYIELVLLIFYLMTQGFNLYFMIQSFSCTYDNFVIY